MAEREWTGVFIAILLMFLIAGLPALSKFDPLVVTQVFVSSVLIIGGSVLLRKAFAYSLDASAKHEIWHFYRYGIRPGWHFPKALPFGIILPAFFAFLGLLAQFPIMLFTFLTYETRALKHRAAKRFGFYSYTEMTDWHNALIGASAIVVVLVFSLIGYLANFEVLAKLAAYYAFWNMLPFSNLDGTHILFGNRVLYAVLAITTLVFTVYAMWI
ncbi:MAG: hypothetical protein KKD18_03400 [Nanoarchaeota archaeon]|nr:hypothetical protein [Nanoarchaeota archaeon]MBU0977436.1 hypothetical protein [Nanoarchaeota archaeon]